MQQVIPNVKIFGKIYVYAGIDATVTFAGRVPGYQGIDQINIQIASNVPYVSKENGVLGLAVIMQWVTASERGSP